MTEETKGDKFKKAFPKSAKTLEETPKEVQKIPKNDSNPFWVKGEWSLNRNHNISEVKRMIQAGLSYQEIRKKACRYFTMRKFNEYYEIASDEIKGETTT